MSTNFLGAPSYDSNSELTISGLVTALSGSEYRTEYSNSQGKAGTTAATLTVHGLPACLATRDCDNVDFRGMYLNGLPAGGVTFQNANFNGVNLDNAAFFGDIMTGVHMVGAHATFADFNGAHLQGADLTNAQLSISDFTNADFTGANLTGANFTHTFVDGANFSGTLVSPPDTTVYATAPVTPFQAWPSPPSLTGLSLADGCPSAFGSWSDGPNEVVCTVANPDGTAGFVVFSVTVDPPVAPTITQNPQDQYAYWSPGNYSATFTATATGHPDPTLQWEVSMDGGKTFNAVLPTPSATDTSTSTVVGPETITTITHADQTVTTVKTITVLGTTTTTITESSDATSTSIYTAGDTTSLTVEKPPLSSTLANEPQYEVEFSNTAGQATTVPATLHVLPAQIPVIVTGSQTYGDSALTDGIAPTWSATVLPVFGVTASGPVSCQLFNPQPPVILGTPPPIDIPPSSKLPAGTYDIDSRTCTGMNPSDTSGDYAPEYIPGGAEFVVNKRTITVSVSGSAMEGLPQPPVFTETDDAAKQGTTLVNATEFACAALDDGTASGTPLLPTTPLLLTTPATPAYTLLGTSCLGPLAPADSTDFVVQYVGVRNGFRILPSDVHVTVAGGQTYGDTSPTLTETDDSATQGATLSGTLQCTGVTANLAAGPHDASQLGCGGLTASSGANVDYSGEFDVSAANATVVADNQTIVYGAPAPSGAALSFHVDGLVNNDTKSVVTGVTCSDSVTGTPPAGTTTSGITCSGGSASNYNLSYAAGDLTVKPAGATVVADPQAITYGATAPSGSSLTFHVNGLVNNDTKSVVTGVTCSDSVTGTPPAGTTTGAITCGGGSASNYTLNYSAGDLTVGKVAATVVADLQTITYGAAAPSGSALTWHATGLANKDVQSVITGVTCTDSVTGTPPVGTTTGAITCSGGSASNYTLGYSAGDLTVGKAAATVVADPQTITYGAAAPSGTSLTWHATGLVNNDTKSVITGVTCADSVTGTPPASTYAGAITCTAGTASNYSLNYTAGDLTVNQAPATVVADPQTITYGAAAPSGAALTWHATRLVHSDSKSVITGVTCVDGVTGTPSASTYAGAITCSGGTAANYSLSYTAGDLTVGTAAATVVADSQTITYSATAPSGSALTWHATGLVNGDGKSVITNVTCSDGVTGTPPAEKKTGAITCSGGTAANYSLSYTAGDLTVDQAPATVVAEGQSITYGATAPSGSALTWHATGLVNGDSKSVISGVACVDSVTGTPPAGTKSGSITCSGGTASNYSLSYSAGDLTVNQAPATVVADPQTITYGAAAPSGAALTWHANGLVNGDGKSVISGVTCVDSVTGTPSASTYTGAITCIGGTAANYSLSYTAGDLKVNQAPATVVADGQTIIYGATAPSGFALTWHATGLVNGDGKSVITNVTCSDGVTGTPPAGKTTGAISCSGGTAANYSLIYTAGDLTVSKAVLTVTADNKAMTYGATALPAFTATITGYVNKDGGSVVSGSPSCTTTAVLTSPAGKYSITCVVSGMSAANYTFTPASGTLTISKHGATVGYTGFMFFATPTTASTSATVTLSALVVPASGGSVDLTKAQVTFDLYNSRSGMLAPDGTCPATSVSSTGVATCTYNGLATDNWTVVPVIPSGNGYFIAPDGDPAIVTVYQQSVDAFGTGGGWVRDPSQNISPANNHGNFGFNVHSTSGGPKGQSVYTFRGADGYDYVVKSNSWTNGGDYITTSTASFSGKCNVIAVDPTTGLPVAGIGGGNYTYRVDVTQGTKGTSTYAISVYTGAGVLWHQAGTTAAQLTLGGGNIVVHAH